jgi:hypothetical protein
VLNQALFLPAMMATQYPFIIMNHQIGIATPATRNPAATMTYQGGRKAAPV